jgi:hypothetical protein
MARKEEGDSCACIVCDCNGINGIEVYINATNDTDGADNPEWVICNECLKGNGTTIQILRNKANGNKISIKVQGVLETTLVHQL